MRIVAGRWRGRQIETPDDERVRPTTDKIREAWMSIVSRDIPGARVVDLFAGSGALGLEALSRGAERVDFVDASPDAVKLITRNVQGLGAGAAARVHRADAVAVAQGAKGGRY
jgi:16S rRNA (guanine966-N2)-methyltransferase